MVDYEWDIETNDKHGDIYDHDHRDKLSEFNAIERSEAADPAYKGSSLVLVRTDEYSREWCYAVNDANTCYLPDFSAGTPVPRRFILEFHKAMGTKAPPKPKRVSKPKYKQESSDIFTYNDGGREAAGFLGNAGDCFCRAVAIAGEQDYQETYDDVMSFMRERYPSTFTSAERYHRKGMYATDAKVFLKERGWVWTATMGIGTGCKVHVRAEELPGGRLILNLSRHFSAFIHGIMEDTYDPSRHGKRCVYGYWQKGKA